MKEQRKAVHRTPDERPQTPGARPVLTEVKRTGDDSEHDRATAEIFAGREEQGNPQKRRLRPMWVILPIVIIVALGAAIWIGAYLIEGIAF